MAFTSGFFNSVNGDRKYDTQSISMFFDCLITDGVMAHYGTHFTTTIVSGRTINIGSGRCWFNHVWGLNDGNYQVTVDQGETAQRIDAIVFDVDSRDTVRAMSIKVVRGGSSAPTMINETKHHQYPIAYVTVPALATSLTAANIQVKVGTSDCPYATGVLESVSIDNLFDNWEGQFMNWFNALQENMSGDVATNLQNQINTLKGDVAEIERKIGYSTISYTVSNISSKDTCFYFNSSGKSIVTIDGAISIKATSITGILAEYTIYAISNITDAYIGRITSKLNGTVEFKFQIIITGDKSLVYTTIYNEDGTVPSDGLRWYSFNGAANAIKIYHTNSTVVCKFINGPNGLCII